MNARVMIALALLAAAGTAAANQPDAKWVSPKGMGQLPPGSIRGFPVHVGGGPRAVSIVYDNTDTTVFSSTVVPSHVLDDASLLPGPADGDADPIVITGIDFALIGNGNAGDPPVSFDAIVEFWDNIDPATDGSALAPQTLIDSLVVEFVDLPADAVGSTDIIDISGLPGGGVSLPNKQFGISIRLVQPGTNTQLPDGVFTPALCDTFDESQWENLQAAGSSEDIYWRDANGNGTIETGEARFFAFGNYSRLFLRLQADVDVGSGGCPADFNGDGFIDFFDFDDFVIAFENGCP